MRNVVILSPVFERGVRQVVVWEFESSHPSHAVGSLRVVSKQSSHRAFGCFSLLILNDRAAPSYQLLDLSLAGLPLDMLFLSPTS